MNEILAIIFLGFITVTTIVGVIHNIYTNKNFLKQSTENFERLKKLDLRYIQDFVEFRKRLDGIEGDTFSIIELRKQIESLKTEIDEIKSFLVLD